MKKYIILLSLLCLGFTMNLNGTTLRDESGWVHDYITRNEATDTSHEFSDNFNLSDTSDPTINDDWAKSTGETYYFTANIRSNRLYITNGDNNSIVYYTGDSTIGDSTQQVLCDPDSYEVGGLCFHSDISGDNSYTVGIRNGSDQGIWVSRQGGTGGNTRIDTHTFTPDGGWYYLKADLTTSGTVSTIRYKYWDTADSEPEWTGVIADDDLINSAEGYVGVFASWGDSVSFDDYSIEWTDN